MAVAFNPVRVAKMQLDAPVDEEQFHVQLEPQRESGGRCDLITLAGPGPRLPRFRHLSVTRDAGGVLIGIIRQLLGASWSVVHAVQRCFGMGGFWRALRLSWKAGESLWSGCFTRPWCGARSRWKGLQNCLQVRKAILVGFVCGSWPLPQQLGRGVEWMCPNDRLPDPSCFLRRTWDQRC